MNKEEINRIIQRANRNLISKYIDQLETKGKSKKNIAQNKSVLKKFSIYCSMNYISFSNFPKEILFNYSGYLFMKLNKTTTIKTHFYIIKTAIKFFDPQKIYYGPSYSLPAPIPQILEKKELEEIFKFCNENKKILERHIIKFILNTGLKTSELLNLKWKDIRILREYGKIKGYGKIFIGKEKREVFLNENSRFILVAIGYYDRFKKKEFYLKVFPLSPSTICRYFEIISSGTGIYITIERLRNTFVKSMLDNGVPIERLAKIMGYKKLSSIRKFLYLSSNEMEMGRDMEYLD